MTASHPIELIIPDWPAPAWVKAASTTRRGGVSVGGYASLNVAAHAGDTPSAVVENRRRLSTALRLPQLPVWLRQVHGNRVVDATTVATNIDADGSFATAPGTVCAVMTADCLPVLLCSRESSFVAAVHAGWRGLAAGIIAEAIRRSNVAPDQLMAWLGPAIGPQVYEVDDALRAQFLNLGTAELDAFQPVRDGHWLADLYALASAQLRRLGVDAIYGGKWCTYSDSERFFSYRRHPHCGRMATLVWLEPVTNS